ncbi:hypothetical protein [Lachnobacterium bovis]|uniref:hypothetical protein n=1 Tax=Lachnobacterium bovis TaxID=140626 RepID=UPI0012DCD9B8|nr:hypothetical protein [Lachnobacterium bovis]
MDMFDGIFDFNGDGNTDSLELIAGLQMTASSKKEAIELTGDDSFYCGDDENVEDN